MAFDGIVVASLASELKHTLLNGRISKIAQPEADELLLTVKSTEGSVSSVDFGGCFSSAGLSDLDRISQVPMTAPNFCMLLRKHISAAAALLISGSPGLERIIHFTIEHLDELGDLCRKDLIVEIMGKHSNIIFCTISVRSLTVSNMYLRR